MAEKTIIAVSYFTLFMLGACAYIADTARSHYESKPIELIDISTLPKKRVDIFYACYTGHRRMQEYLDCRRSLMSRNDM